MDAMKRRVALALMTAAMLLFVVQAGGPPGLAHQPKAGGQGPAAPSAEATCSSCADCSSKLAGGLYAVVRLTTDLLNVGGPCVSAYLGESGLIFDCGGHTIDGDDQAIDPDWGITMMHGSDNEIRNCVVSDFSYGIYLWDTTNHTLSNNVTISNSAGIYQGFSNSNLIANNRSNANGTGIFLTSSDNNTINGNVVCDNSVTDFRLDSSSGNTGDNNTCDEAGTWNDTGSTGCSYSCSLRFCNLPLVVAGSGP